jgi:uncharacterized membrane protein
LVVNDTTSGHVNSRVFIYEHGTFQKRKKKSAEFAPRRLNGEFKININYEKNFVDFTNNIFIFLSKRG